MNHDLRICIIGAGPSGITAAKNLLDAGFRDTVIYDRGRAVGGNWVFDAESGHSSVFETTKIGISTWLPHTPNPSPQGGWKD